MEKVFNEPLISVIVPVYNVEQYLKKCIDSIINQTYKNLEIILIDDGSQDNCPKICDEYVKKDKRIKVIHKQNGGLSDARNKGIEIANGKYLTFIDSDDYIATDFIEYLYKLNTENNTLISIAPYIVVTDKKILNYTTDSNFELLDQKEALNRMLLDNGYTVSACSKLYDRSLFDNIKYPVGKIFEDTATTYKLFLKCDYVTYGHTGGYYYYKRDNSIINSKYNKNQLLFIEFTDMMGNDIINKYPELSNSVENKRIDARFSVFRRMIMSKNLNDEDKKKKNEIKKYILSRKGKIIFGKYNKKIKLATFLLSINESIFKFFWNIYTKIKYKK